jgi:uncharacterized protein (DUF2141 family)
MKTTIFFIALTILTSAFRSENKGSLTITLSNISKTGKINVAVYKAGEEFPEDKYLVKGQTGECKSSTCMFTFTELPYGEYAVAIYQDVNTNGKLDTGTFGIPSEPFAFSNNFRPRFGGPTFEKCKFNFSKDKQVVEITMINKLFGGG